MNKHTVIGISGKMGSGKTTLAKALMEKYSGAHLKFATPLYEMHEAIRDVLLKYNCSAMPVKDGKLLQLLGTEWGRHTLGQNIWADLTYNAIVDGMSVYEKFGDTAFIIVDDARFENELEMFSKLKRDNPDWRVLTIRLEADEDVRKARAEGWRENTQHASEIGLDHRLEDFDIVIRTQDTTKEAVLEQVCARIDQ